MKLTDVEERICKKFSERDEDGFVHCDECPLNLDWLVGDAQSSLCYATINGKRKDARSLKRYREEDER